MGSQITNQKISAKSVECSTSPFTADFMTCAFEDELGTRKDVRNIVFTNYDVRRPKFTTYKQSDSGEIVTKVDFTSPAICEILGHNSIGLTTNCRDKSIAVEDDKNRNRAGGNWS